MLQGEGLFADLPAGLVEALLEQAPQLSESLRDSMEGLRARREQFRKDLEQEGYLHRAADLPREVEIPTVCGVDGSYVIDRMLGQDFLGMAAVAVEGLAPPSEKRPWPEPRFQPWVSVEPPNEGASVLLRALMIGEELRLAEKAPHAVVLLDGSLTTPLIYFNQALTQMAQQKTPSRTAERLRECLEEILKAYATLLEAKPTDRLWAAVPKRTTRRELARKMNWPEGYDDRGLLSLILAGGEYIRPLPLQSPDQPWHLPMESLPAELRETAENIIQGLQKVQVLYYRPSTHQPVLRVEIPSAVATNRVRLAMLIQALFYQCPSARFLEPYPLYFADRIVKSLTGGIKALRSVILHAVSKEYKGELSEVFLMLHSYRTET